MEAHRPLSRIRLDFLGSTSMPLRCLLTYFRLYLAADLVEYQGRLFLAWRSRSVGDVSRLVLDTPFLGSEALSARSRAHDPRAALRSEHC